MMTFFAGLGNNCGDIFSDGRALNGLRVESIHRGGLGCQRHFSQVLSQLNEFIVAGNEVGFAVDFDKSA